MIHHQSLIHHLEESILDQNEHKKTVKIVLCLLHYSNVPEIYFVYCTIAIILETFYMLDILFKNSFKSTLRAYYFP